VPLPHATPVTMSSQGTPFCKVALTATLPSRPTNSINSTGWPTLLSTYRRLHSTLYKPRIDTAGFLSGFLTSKDGTDRLSRNVGNDLFAA